MRYGPAVDRWVVVVLVVAGMAMVTGTVAVALDPGVGLGTLVLFAATNLLTAGAVWALAYPIVYEVDLDEVRVRAGVLRHRLALADLERLELTTSIVSSTTAAWTMRRVRLIGRGGRVLEVGPADRTGFVAEVLARAPQLVEDVTAGRGRAWHVPHRGRRR